jgi:hypothetical protein
MGKPKKHLSDAAATGQRIEWLLAAAYEEEDDGSGRHGVVVDALIEAAREQAKELARL